MYLVFKSLTVRFFWRVLSQVRETALEMAVTEKLWY